MPQTGSEIAYRYSISNRTVNEDHHVEGFGKAGDVLLWHRLLAHAAGHNRSKKIQLREAVLCDYKKYEELDSPDLVSYRDMWCQWSEEVSLTAS